jgi:hypothetical protein
MAKLISVSAWYTPADGALPATAQRLINTDNIQGVKAAPASVTALYSGAQSIIDYSYNQGNAFQNGDIIVTQAVSALLAAASA